ncbi:lipid A biosynthesis lauroyl acyltransferase [Rhodopseudomonas sp. HC1]|uniref:lipid A biosynthesis lauroyl acyltransferase n=1 Tax=Rhodopseudomonas infernalis TaxID=2897386 RepID=UPI001EE905D6|nr:lipid A biosynthesis lauroyl acyltransferase [Rhodopseudomonas infernalis]MCG6203024.1 lipid A biosynthesis lauroyl acyltransferase [Rhodopseudomonas infernalis]
MKLALYRAKLRAQRAAKTVVGKAAGSVAIGALHLARKFDPAKTADFFGALVRKLGPLLPEQRIGRDNLTAAFPEKSVDEIETILAGVWDNLGRSGAEFAHLDSVWDYDPDHPERSRIEVTPRSLELFEQLRSDGKPALIFASHLGNWELPAVAAVAHGLDTAVLYRRPNIEAADRIVEEIRSVKMGQLIAAGRTAPFKLAQALQEGKHVGMLIDQHFSNGVDVTFFGRTCKANPMLARLLRQIDCPVHGARVIRMPDGKFRAELTEEIQPVRDATGQIDIQGTMQTVTAVIEGWIRETPEQWLWLHRRWR